MFDMNFYLSNILRTFLEDLSKYFIKIQKNFFAHQKRRLRKRLFCSIILAFYDLLCFLNFIAFYSSVNQYNDNSQTNNNQDNVNGEYNIKSFVILDDNLNRIFYGSIIYTNPYEIFYCINAFF